MTKKIHPIVIKWREVTEELAKAFARQYYPNHSYEDDSFWIGDEVGGVFSISQSFYDVNRMIEALELNVTYERLMEYEEFELDHALSENADKPTPVNFRNFVKLSPACK